MEASLEERLSTDLKQAMKNGNTTRRDVVRLVMSAIRNAEIAKQSTLEETDVLGVIAKEARQRQESIDAFKQGGRDDLVSKEEAEMKILQAYLPEQMSRDDIAAAAREVIAAVGAQGPGDKGNVMKELMPKLKGKADGKEINEVVTELLNQ